MTNRVIVSDLGTGFVETLLLKKTNVLVGFETLQD